eukprot:c20659_g1_i1 orf=396-1574(+)
MEKFSAIGEKLKVGGSDLGRKMSAGMNTMSGKMREFFQVPTQADRLVEEATAENLQGPDWSKNIDICDMVNVEKISGQDIIRAIKKRLVLKSPKIQLLTLSLLETCVKNCEKMFSEVASERVLDEMVKTIDDPQTPTLVREKALKLIESWGESTEELRYLPVFEETYKSLKSRGIRFPGRDEESLAPIFTPPQSVSNAPTNRGSSDRNVGEAAGLQGDTRTSPEYTKEVFDIARNSVELLSTVLSSSPQQEALKEELTSTLVEQCRRSEFNVQQIIHNVGDNEALLFEALTVNEDLQHVLSKYEEMLTSPIIQSSQPSGPALIPVRVGEEESAAAGVEDALVRNRTAKPSAPRSTQGDDAAMADLDEMIFGRTGGEHSSGSGAKKNGDLIIF